MLEIALLLIGAGVAIRVEDARNISETEQKTIVSSLGAAIEARAGRKAIVEAIPPQHCTPDPCPAPPRTEASDIILLRLFGVPTRIRLVVERLVAGRSPPGRTAEADLLRNGEPWSSTLEEIAAALFPEARPKSASTEGLHLTKPPAPERPSPSSLGGHAPAKSSPDEASSLVQWIPWAMIGSGVAAGSIGIGLGLSARGARDAARSEPHTTEEIGELEDRALGHGLAANVLFGAALAGAAAGVTWLLLEDQTD